MAELVRALHNQWRFSPSMLKVEGSNPGNLYCIMNYKKNYFSQFNAHALTRIMLVTVHARELFTSPGHVQIGKQP